MENEGEKLSERLFTFNVSVYYKCIHILSDNTLGGREIYETIDCLINTGGDTEN